MDPSNSTQSQDGSLLPGLLRWAKRVLQIPSTTSKGTAALAQFLHDEVLSTLPLQRRLIAANDRHRPDYSLLGAFVPTDKLPGLLLVTHLDTVEAGDPTLWTETAGKPFSPAIKGDRIYGIGSADTKLDWLCKAEALRRCLEREDLRRPLYLVGTFGEENGMTGTDEFLATSPFPQTPIAAFIGEPTGLEPVNRTKGRLLVNIAIRWLSARPRHLWLRPVRFFGRSAHSSRPDLGTNAAQTALAAIPPGCQLLAAVEGGDAGNKVPARCQLLVDADNPELLSRFAVAGAEIEAARMVEASPLEPAAIDASKEIVSVIDQLVNSKSLRDSSFSSPQATICLTGISGRRGELNLQLDIRLLPGQSSREFVDNINSRLLSLKSAGKGVTSQLTVICDNPALDLPQGSDVIVRLCSILRSLGLPEKLATKTGCTEAGLFTAAGIPSLVLGPGASYGNIHAPNEFNSIEQLTTAVSVYEAIIKEFCA